MSGSTSPAESAADAPRTNPPAPRPRFIHRYNQRVQGWVVIDRQTNMQVVGPFSLEWVAERAAAKRNGINGSK